MISKVKNVCAGLKCSDNVNNQKESGKFSSLLNCSSFEFKPSHVQNIPTVLEFGVYLVDFPPLFASLTHGFTMDPVVLSPYCSLLFSK